MARQRRGGGGGGGSMFGRRPAAPARPHQQQRSSSSSAPAPQQQQQSHVPAPQGSSGGGGMLAGIGSTIAQGMAFGTGSAVAHRAVGAVAGGYGGGGTVDHQQPQDVPEYAQGSTHNQQKFGGACAQDKEMYYECLNYNKGDHQSCQFLYEQVQQCQLSQSQMY